MHEIARLTRQQVYHVYLRPRDKDGSLLRAAHPGGGPRVPWSRMFVDVWMKRGRTKEEAEAMLEEERRKDPHLVAAMEVGLA